MRAVRRATLPSMTTASVHPTTPVRVRYAPSPTGAPHIGNLRTAMYDWILARQTGGQFIVRIEDTDQERFVQGGIEMQLDSLRWLGLDWDDRALFNTESSRRGGAEIPSGPRQ